MSTDEYFTLEPCACGGVIKADYRDPRGIAYAVAQHNKRGRHAEWRALGGFEYDPEAQGRHPADLRLPER